MRTWNNRSKEISFLFNPAYCGKILYFTIKKYNEISRKGNFPFALIYLVLPILLYPQSIERINVRTRFSKFVNDNPELLINFAQRSKNLITITNEAIEFLMAGRAIDIDQNATFYCVEEIKTNNDEIVKKAEAIGKMFANAGTVNIIYLMLGVKP